MRAAVLLALAAAAGCYSPSVPDNIYQCTDPDRTCPAGLVCNACRSCVHAGSALDAGACESCGQLAQCYIDKACHFGDTACVQSCLANGTPTAQQLGEASLECVNGVCGSRCALFNGPSCTACTDNVARGPGSPLGLCTQPNDPACGQCVSAYKKCIDDHSGI